MARLPSERYIIQEIDGEVVLFEDGSGRELVRAWAHDSEAMAQAQQVIYSSDLRDEDKCFAHFWFGYYYAMAGGQSG